MLVFKLCAILEEGWLHVGFRVWLCTGFVKHMQTIKTQYECTESTECFFFFEKHILFGKKGTVVQETNHKISRPFCFALLTIAIKTTQKKKKNANSIFPVTSKEL